MTTPLPTPDVAAVWPVRRDLVRLGVLTAIVAFQADWASKAWALDSLQGSVPLGALMLGVVHNDAFAFSAGSGTVSRALVIAVRVAALLLLVLACRRLGVQRPRHAVGVGLIVGGGLGNAADLLFRANGVVDFIGAGPFFFQLADHTLGFHLVFNAADLSVLMGIGLLAPLISSWAVVLQQRLAHWERRWLGRAT